MRARPENQGGQASSLPPRAGSQAGESVTTAAGSVVTPMNSEPVANAPKVAQEDLAARDGLVRGSAVGEGDEQPEVKPGEKAPELLRYLVMADLQFTDTKGHRVKLLRGKVVDNLNYDVRRIIQAGGRLKRVRDVEEAADLMVEGGFVD